MLIEDRLFPHMPTDLRLRLIWRDDSYYDLIAEEYDGEAPRNPVARDVYTQLTPGEACDVVSAIVEVQLGQ